MAWGGEALRTPAMDDMCREREVAPTIPAVPLEAFIPDGLMLIPPLFTPCGEGLAELIARELERPPPPPPAPTVALPPDPATLRFPVPTTAPCGGVGPPAMPMLLPEGARGSEDDEEELADSDAAGVELTEG